MWSNGSRIDCCHQQLEQLRVAHPTGTPAIGDGPKEADQVVSSGLNDGSRAGFGHWKGVSLLTKPHAGRTARSHVQRLLGSRAGALSHASSARAGPADSPVHSRAPTPLITLGRRGGYPGACIALRIRPAANARGMNLFALILLSQCVASATMCKE